MKEIPIVVGGCGKVPKGIENWLEELKIKGKIDTNKTIPLLRSARILRRVPETWLVFLLVRLQWKTTSKHLQGEEEL